MRHGKTWLLGYYLIRLQNRLSQIQGLDIGPWKVGARCIIYYLHCEQKGQTERICRMISAFSVHYDVKRSHIPIMAFLW